MSREVDSRVWIDHIPYWFFNVHFFRLKLHPLLSSESGLEWRLSHRQTVHRKYTGYNQPISPKTWFLVTRTRPLTFLKGSCRPYTPMVSVPPLETNSGVKGPKFKGRLFTHSSPLYKSYNYLTLRPCKLTLLPLTFWPLTSTVFVTYDMLFVRIRHVPSVTCWPCGIRGDSVQDMSFLGYYYLVFALSDPRSSRLLLFPLYRSLYPTVWQNNLPSRVL